MYLNFSDAAKYATIARNLINNLGYKNDFSFWNNSFFENVNQIFYQPWILPLMPSSIAVFFKILGVGDLAVIATSIFYFILTLLFVFLLSRKIFKNNLIGVLSTFVVGFNVNVINYATTGASESPFLFEIAAAAYFASFKRVWSFLAMGFLLILMYFTRPQAFIYILGIIFYWLINTFKTKKAIFYFAGVLIVGFLVDYFLLSKLSGKFFLYSVLSRSENLVAHYMPGDSVSDALRGQTFTASILDVFKKVFYNIYNFYKLLPEIINPYIFTLFIIGLFIKFNNEGDRLTNSFKLSSLFMVLSTFLVASASIPFFRYIHPVIPLVSIIGVGALVEILKTRFKTKIYLNLVSVFLVLVFSVGQTIGVLLLDSRFERNTHNFGKPPVYIKLSEVLKENTQASDIVITNLDSWGSWYGERKTVWFPVEPKQLINPQTNTIPFDAIYLTSYMLDDQNYYMGDSWRLIFNNPMESSRWTCQGCREIAKEFVLKGVYEIPANENYERQDAKGVLLVRK